MLNEKNEIFVVSETFSMMEYIVCSSPQTFYKISIGEMGRGMSFDMAGFMTWWKMSKNDYSDYIKEIKKQTELYSDSLLITLADIIAQDKINEFFRKK